MVVDTGAANIPARKFYAALGFEEEDITVSRAIDFRNNRGPFYLRFEFITRDRRPGVVSVWSLTRSTRENACKSWVRNHAETRISP